MPREFDDAARVEGAGALRVLPHVYLPLARPTPVAYGFVSVSHHWNNLLWPLIVTNAVATRPITVGLLTFASPDPGVSWTLVAASNLMSSGPLLLGFLLFQRTFVQSFMRAGIKRGLERIGDPPPFPVGERSPDGCSIGVRRSATAVQG